MVLVVGPETQRERKKTPRFIATGKTGKEKEGDKYGVRRWERRDSVEWKRFPSYSDVDRKENKQLDTIPLVGSIYSGRCRWEKMAGKCRAFGVDGFWFVLVCNSTAVTVASSGKDFHS